MFNKQKLVEAQLATEKYLREHNIGPKADDQQAIWDKELKHRKGNQYTTTEAQFERKNADQELITEKQINRRKSPLVTHRSSDDFTAPVHPHNILVEKLQSDRMDDWKTEKSDHWSHTFNEKKQQGTLPKWPKQPDQQESITLANDPRRFKDCSSDPTKWNTSKVSPLVGTITTASIHKVAEGIKTGVSVDYDAAIIAILREADLEERELTKVEQMTIADLKIARTRALLG